MSGYGLQSSQKDKAILGLTISKERNTFVTERLSHVWSRLMENMQYQQTVELCPQACRFLKLKRHIHSSLEKSLIERTMQHIKDTTDRFDDYFPCVKKDAI